MYRSLGCPKRERHTGDLVDRFCPAKLNLSGIPDAISSYDLRSSRMIIKRQFAQDDAGLNSCMDELLEVLVQILAVPPVAAPPEPVKVPPEIQTVLLPMDLQFRPKQSDQCER